MFWKIVKVCCLQLTVSDLVFSGQQLFEYKNIAQCILGINCSDHGRQRPGQWPCCSEYSRQVNFASEASGPQKTKKSVSEEILNFLDVGTGHARALIFSVDTYLDEPNKSSSKGM